MAQITKEPLGLQVIGSGRLVAQAFEQALGEVGASLPEWLVLVSSKARHQEAHDHLAHGSDGTPPVDHLERMEAAGLVRLHRSGPGGPVRHVELTEEGDRAFNRALKAVVAFDRQLRAGVTDEQVAALEEVLARLRRNLAAPPPPEGRG